MPITNFYLTDPISRASETMAQCTEAFGAGQRRRRAPMDSLLQSLSDFTATPIGQGILIVVYILCIVVPLLLCVAYLTYAERKVMGASAAPQGARMWSGPFGLLQPFADGIKLLAKETIIPTGANRVVFLLAPMITFVLALMAWAVIPFDATAGAVRHQCRHALSLRHLVARRLRHHHGRLGLQLEIRRSSARCVRRRRWCPTKSPSAS